MPIASLFRPLLRYLTKRRRKRDRFRALFESSPNALITVREKDGTIALVNPKVEEIFGYLPDELIGKRIEVLIPERFHHSHEKVRRGYVKMPSARGMGVGRHLFARRKDGREIAVEIALTPIESDEGAVILTTVSDISARAALEHERDEALKAREELVAVVSHEIRNPLNTIVMALQLIRRQLPKTYDNQDKIEKQMQSIESAVQRTIAITSDLLDVTRIEAGYVLMEPASVGIQELMEEAIGPFRLLAEKKGVSLAVQASHEAMQVSCDRRRMVQVLSNLVGNAIKFTDGGGAVSVAAQRKENQVCFEVHDTGAGIPADELPRVFERFWQAKHKQYLGSGLGLYIARKIVEAHRGAITADSKPGTGSRFVVTLPLCVLPSQQNSA